MPADQRELYDLYREYRQDPRDGKIRPNLVIDVSGDDVFCLPLTRTPPSDPPKWYDRWKVELRDWREANLDQPSWVLVDALQVFDTSAVSIRNMRGELSDHDWESLVKRTTQYGLYVAQQKRRQARRQALIATNKKPSRR